LILLISGLFAVIRTTIPQINTSPPEIEYNPRNYFLENMRWRLTYQIPIYHNGNHGSFSKFNRSNTNGIFSKFANYQQYDSQYRNELNPYSYFVENQEIFEKNYKNISRYHYSSLKAGIFFNQFDLKNHKLDLDFYFSNYLKNELLFSYLNLMSSSFISNITNGRYNISSSYIHPIGVSFSSYFTFFNVFDLVTGGSGTYSFLLIAPLPLILYTIILEKNKGNKDMMLMVF
jgi:hypothetical protein